MSPLFATEIQNSWKPALAVMTVDLTSTVGAQWRCRVAYESELIGPYSLLQLTYARPWVGAALSRCTGAGAPQLVLTGLAVAL